MPLSVSRAVPLFSIVNDWAALLAPTEIEPKACVPVLSARSTPPVPTPSNTAISGVAAV